MVSMATIVMQSDPYPQNGIFSQELSVIIYLLKTSLDCHFCMPYYVYCPNDHIVTVLLFYFKNLIGQKTLFCKIWAQEG